MADYPPDYGPRVWAVHKFCESVCDIDIPHIPALVDNLKESHICAIEYQMPLVLGDGTAHGIGKF